MLLFPCHFASDRATVKLRAFKQVNLKFVSIAVKMKSCDIDFFNLI